MTLNRILLFGLFLGIVVTHPAHALTLDDCLAAALDENPTLEAAARRTEAASAAVDSARSGYFPTITLAGSYARTDNPGQAFFMNLNQRTATLDNDFNQPPDSDNYRGSLAFKMLLLDAGQRGLMADMADHEEEASQALHTAVRNELIHQVTRAFYSVHQAGAFVTVNEETVSSIEASLRVARERFEAGAAIKTDVLNLEVQLAEAHENLIRSSNDMHLAVAALNTAIGRELVSTGSELEPLDPASLTPPPDALPASGVEGRPELLVARLRAEAAEFDVSRIQRNRMPRLSAYGSIDYDSDTISGFEDSYLVGAVVEMDVFTGYRNRSEAAQAKAREAEARANLAGLENRLRLELIQSHLEAGEAWSCWQVARQSVASADESLRVTRERYEQGAADITELMAAQVGVTATMSRTVAAQYDYAIACSNLERAAGTQSISPPEAGEQP